MADALDRPLEYAWWPQRRGFARNTLNAGICDLIMGVPAGYEMAQTSRPYYRSSYVFVTRPGDRIHITSLDDPVLKTLSIGVHVVGDDGANVPPAQALIERGMAANLRGYSIYGDYSLPNPPADLLTALTRKEVDVAIAWGPLAGYFAERAPVALDVTLIPSEDDLSIPLSYAIAMGVRRGDRELLNAVNGFIADRQSDIDALLREYGVPLVPHAD